MSRIEDAEWQREQDAGERELREHDRVTEALVALGEAAVEYSVELDSWVTDGGLAQLRRANDAFRALRSAALAYAKVRKGEQ